MSLNGVDVSGHNWGNGRTARPIHLREVEGDFFIIKSTEGTQGVVYNTRYEEMAEQALSTGRLIGFYHYANGDDPIEEADCFYDSIKDYKGRAVPALDWEGQGNHLFETGQDVAWCKRFMDRISSLMGSTCLFYTSKGVCNEYDWSSCASYPLWGAEYPNYENVYGYDGDPWQSRRSWGAWGAHPTIHQYTSCLVLENDGGCDHYDGNIFYGTREDWERMCGSKPAQPSTTPVNDANLLYRAHSQDLGWLPAVRDGQTAGTVGFGKRLEAFKISPPKGWTLWAKVHVANVGWVTYEGITQGKSSGEGSSANDPIIGTVGKGSAIECVMLGVSKRPEGDKRRLRFRVHQQDKGWKGWTLEGFASGTDGMGLRLEAIEMVIK